ncbi:major tail protein [Mycobacterium phage Orange]|nr:major tail protein [Mycobacterium phage Jabith]ASR86660.1 major tail protein [Mycobacterium phage Et2Brutus]QBI97859.1 major tail protein [Mycobacterium phage Orange]QBI98197.1 major tail protein [Mycobacterium phage Bowtie]QBI98491.1 major tail protein [Mycobacterium phage Bud]UAW08894.1 major tail protein [Mycobacterium phage Lucivia]
MALNDDAVFTAAVGYVYVGPEGTAAPTPTQLKTLNLTDTSSWSGGSSAWRSVGHTSRNTLPEFGFEGGEPEMKGSWQKKKLREVYGEDPVDFVSVVLHQFDEEALELYYGPNGSTDPGVFGYKPNQTNEKALLIIIEDGDLRLGHHSFKTSVKRDEAIELPIDDLAALPVRFTYLDYQDKLPFYWINEELFNVAPPSGGGGGGGED